MAAEHFVDDMAQRLYVEHVHFRKDIVGYEKFHVGFMEYFLYGFM